MLEDYWKLMLTIRICQIFAHYVLGTILLKKKEITLIFAFHYKGILTDSYLQCIGVNERFIIAQFVLLMDWLLWAACPLGYVIKTPLHFSHSCSSLGRLVKLLEEIMQEKENKTLIFTETKKKSDELVKWLRRDGWVTLVRDWVFLLLVSTYNLQLWDIVSH